MHTAMNEVVMVWVIALSAASVLTRAWSAAWKSPFDAPWLARPASPASSIFIPAATKAAELALMVPVVAVLFWFTTYRRVMAMPPLWNLRAAGLQMYAVIDFVNTLDTDEGTDAFATREGLGSWLVNRGLLHAADLPLREADRREAIRLREALLALMLAHNGVGADEHAADGRADQCGQLEHRRVDTDRVAQLIRFDQFGDERLPGGIVNRGNESETERDDIDVPWLYLVAQREISEHRPHR